MEKDIMKTTCFAIYPSTLKRIRDFKKTNDLSWDKLFNMLLDNFENK